MNLSKHFTLQELTASQVAGRLGLDNTPSKEIINALTILAGKLEEVREVLGVPMVISSGYRSPDINRIVRGAKNSMHLQGYAADFIAPKYGDPYAVAKRIEQSGVVVDQVIHEFGQWVHLSFTGKSDDRREFLTICNSRDGYRRGVFKC